MSHENQEISVSETETEDLPPSISQLLCLPYQISRFISKPLSFALICPMLMYHLFIYIYLGQQSGGADFYSGFMYAFNYAGAAVAYWIICRQSQTLLSSVNIISKEVVETPEHSVGRGCFHNCLARYQSSHFQLLHNNLVVLKDYSQEYDNFCRYCNRWQKRMVLIFIIWMGFATVNILAKVFPEKLFTTYKSFDDKPLALNGYYNLSGQYIAALTIVTGAVTLLSGFYQLKCLIIGFANHLRQYRIVSAPGVHGVGECTNQQRETYLRIQKACVALGELWSVPIVVSLFFCTQVVISNILVIHYSLRDCQATKNCDFHIVYPVIWLLAGLFIMAIILMSMANINQASAVLKQIFVYSKGGDTEYEDYQAIGGRKSWMDYLDSNRLEFCICGMAITPTLVINTSYTIGTAIASILASYILG